MNARFPRSAAPLKCMLALLALATTPWALAEESATASGAVLFKRLCASCHGVSGAGDGPVAPILKKTPPHLRQMALRNGGTFPTERAIRVIDGRDLLYAHGAINMPVWGQLLGATSGGSPAEAKVAVDSSIGSLVEYLKSIQEKK